MAYQPIQYFYLNLGNPNFITTVPIIPSVSHADGQSGWLMDSWIWDPRKEPFQALVLVMLYAYYIHIFTL